MIIPIFISVYLPAKSNAISSKKWSMPITSDTNPNLAAPCEWKKPIYFLL
jgi:hypothetical protein